MSTVIKKLLFFFVLSIVYNSTLSDDDCIANIREIFIKYKLHATQNEIERLYEKEIGKLKIDEENEIQEEIDEEYEIQEESDEENEIQEEKGKSKIGTGCFPYLTRKPSSTSDTRTGCFPHFSGNAASTSYGNQEKIDEEYEIQEESGTGCFPYLTGKPSSTSYTNEKLENQEKIGHFIFAMFAISEPLVNSWKRSPAELISLFEDNKHLMPIFDKPHIKSSTDIINKYFGFLKEYNNISLELSSLRITNNNTSLESKKNDIIGYFQMIINKLEKYERYINVMVMDPIQFCQKYYASTDDTYNTCIHALRAMLNFEANASENEVRRFFRLNGYNVLKHGYLNYSFFYFTTDNEEEEDKEYEDDEETKELKMGVMYNYFYHMVFVSQEIAKNFKNQIAESLPTVEEYCRTRS